jgi:biopolymer transport protein ExbB/TolQ
VEVSLRALGMAVLAFQDQKSSLDIVSLVMKAHWVEQAVMLILLLFSAVSWGVIAYKYAQLRRVAKQNAQFLSVFRKSSRFSEVQAICAEPAGELIGRALQFRVRRTHGADAIVR